MAVANNATLGNYLWYVNNNHKKKTKIDIAKLDAADVNVPVAGASLKLSKWGRPKRRKPGRIGLHQCRVSAKIPLVPH